MKHFWKINIYEIQHILYWILGVLILNIGEWHLFGWTCIVYGWFNFAFTTIYTIKNREEVIKELNPQK